MSEKGIESSVNNKEPLNSLGRLLSRTDPNLTCRSRSENKPHGYCIKGVASEDASTFDTMTHLRNSTSYELNSVDHTSQATTDELLIGKELDHQDCYYAASNSSPRPRRRRTESCSKQLSWETKFHEDKKDAAKRNGEEAVKSQEAVSSSVANVFLGYFKKVRPGKSHP